jgi:hypothetical protein
MPSFFHSEGSSPGTRSGRFALDLYKPEDLMRLDLAAQRALHVFPTRGESLSNNTTSIYGILNHTRTAMGKRLLRNWLKQPLRDVKAITGWWLPLWTTLRCGMCACALCGHLRLLVLARACSCVFVRASDCRATSIHNFLPPCYAVETQNQESTRQSQTER